jgi:hypothetical protein
VASGENEENKSSPGGLASLAYSEMTPRADSATRIRHIIALAVLMAYPHGRSIAAKAVEHD